VPATCPIGRSHRVLRGYSRRNEQDHPPAGSLVSGISALIPKLIVRGVKFLLRKLLRGTRLQAVLAGMDHVQIQAEMPEVCTLAGAGQGFETFAAAVRARQEIEVAMRKLMVQSEQQRASY
jgi:hypothetical protein